MSEQQTKIAEYLHGKDITFTATGGQQTKRDGWGCFAWNTEFRRSGATLEQSFYCGLAHVTKPKSEFVSPRPVPPCAADVLYSVLSDAEALGESFVNWCANYGFDSDSLRAFDTYRECCASGEKLNKFFFMRDELSELRTLLQDY